MTAGVSLHIGLNRVDATHYGSELVLSGCKNDAHDMARIASTAGYDATLLLDHEASASAVLGYVLRASQSLGAGDAFVLTYAGHGAQVSDEGGDEPDGLDETWVLFDRMLLDDELHVALCRFVSGVRVLVISDSCHSGSVARAREYLGILSTGPIASYYSRSSRFRTPDEAGFGRRVWQQHAATYDRVAHSLPHNARELVRAAVIQISGCQDDQLSADGGENGLFTSMLKQVWSGGAFSGSHRAFWQAIARRMPPTQSPGYLTFGQSALDLEKQRPFALLEGACKTTETKAGGNYMYIEKYDQGNWLEVRAELERRIPGWKSVPILQKLEQGDGWVSGPSLPGSSLDSRIGFVGANAAPDSRAPTGPAIVRAFFWGFHIEISSEGLRTFLSVADPINAIVASIGPVTGPAAPFVTLAAAFVAGALRLLEGLDKGSGVYISMSWFAPGLFIPTTVPTRSANALAPVQRSRGEVFEQAGDPWQRDYGGGLFGLRLEEDILWNLPDGTVRENVIVNLNPPGFGNIHFNGWLSDDPTVGHFRLHVGVAAFQGGRVNLRMMIRNKDSRDIESLSPTGGGPKRIGADDVFDRARNGMTSYASP
jgi:metacaspase-1